ncbi:hypothetical protein ON010_g17826 [Phytophthora cinnamomi]|nr:hypothetical protein ON010_g17826 [Phytophthora cinnamomi]
MADPQPVKVPPTFKTLLPFIRRAEELDRDTSRPESKLIAYFCRQYAMELGIKLRENDASNDATDYLLSLMDRLEDEKNKLPDFTQEEGKAATILKAIKEGNVPTPGPPDGLDLKGAEDGTDDAPPTSSIPSAPQPPTPTMPVSSPQPPQPLEPAFKQEPFPSLTESARSAGVMSASELDSTWHGPATTHATPPPPAPSHSAPPAPPAPTYSVPAAPPAPTPAYQPPSTPAPAYQPPSAPMPPYQPPSAPAPSYQPPPSYTAQSTPSRPRNTPISQNEINDAIEYAKFAVAALKVKDMKLAEERLEMALRNIRGA